MKRNKRVEVRFSDAEYSTLSSLASSQNTTLSHLVRQSALTGETPRVVVNQAKTDLAIAIEQASAALRKLED